MKISSMVDLIKKRKYGEVAENSTEWLIKHNYVYSPIFGWEKASVVERFGLDPNLTGVPTELKPKIIEIKATGKDKYGNVVKGAEGTTSWGRHEAEKERYVADNYLAYLEYKKDRDRTDIFLKNISNN